MTFLSTTILDWIALDFFIIDISLDSINLFIYLFSNKAL